MIFFRGRGGVPSASALFEFAGAPQETISLQMATQAGSAIVQAM